MNDDIKILVSIGLFFAIGFALMYIYEICGIVGQIIVAVSFSLLPLFIAFYFSDLFDKDQQREKK